MHDEVALRLPSSQLPIVLACAGLIVALLAPLSRAGDSPARHPLTTAAARGTFATELTLMQYGREIEKAEDADRLDRAMRWLSAMLTIDEARAAAAAAASAASNAQSQPAAVTAPAPAARVSLSGTMPQQLLQLMNQRRATAGLAPLGTDAALAGVAAAFAQELLENRRASHTGVDGSTIEDRLAAAGFAGAPGGEVIAFGTDGWPAADIVAAWMASASHRPLLMSPAYNLAGVACADDGIELRCVAEFAG